MPGEHVIRRDVADGAVQADVVVMVYVTLNQTPRILQRQRRSATDALLVQDSQLVGREFPVNSLFRPADPGAQLPIIRSVTGLQ
jgi:hypothetical protein